MTFPVVTMLILPFLELQSFWGFADLNGSLSRTARATGQLEPGTTGGHDKRQDTAGQKSNEGNRMDLFGRSLLESANQVSSSGT